MAMTLNEAARRVGKGRTSLLRHVRAGRLSATKDEAGAWSVDEAELVRVYPEAFALAERADDTARAPAEAPGGPRAETAGELAVRVELLTDALARERETVERERGRAEGLQDRLDAANERLAGLLAPPPRRTLGGTLGAAWGRLLSPRGTRAGI